MKDATLLKTGIVGTVIAAICCFTPALVILLGAVGLSAWLGWLDYVLLPALALFLGITAYGLWRRQRLRACCTPETQARNEGL
jgi:mercuric ion transport protein